MPLPPRGVQGLSRRHRAVRAADSRACARRGDQHARNRQAVHGARRGHAGALNRPDGAHAAGASRRRALRAGAAVAHAARIPAATARV